MFHFFLIQDNFTGRVSVWLTNLVFTDRDILKKVVNGETDNWILSQINRVEIYLE